MKIRLVRCWDDYPSVTLGYVVTPDDRAPTNGFTDEIQKLWAKFKENSDDEFLDFLKERGYTTQVNEDQDLELW